MRVWLIVIGGGVVTYLTRASFILLGERAKLPATVQGALRYVAPASFAAITVPAILGGDGFADFGDDVPRILAMILAGAAIYRTKSVPLSLVVGMTALWSLQWAGL